MEDSLVSVIIPVYKVEDYIEKCSRSVFQQTYRNLEIIFVDDCTPDNSIWVLKKVIEDYPERKTQVKILKHEHNRGLSAARNTGMEAAMGEFIYFLDSDDEITADCIETLVKPMEADNYDFVVGDVKCVGFKGNDPAPRLQIYGKVLGDDIISSYKDGKWSMTAWNKLISRKFLIDNGITFKEGLIHEDELWTFWTALTAKKIYTVNKQTYLYFFRAGSIIATKNLKKELDSFLTIVEGMRKLQRKLKHYDDCTEQIINRFQLTLIRLMKSSNISLRDIYSTVRNADCRPWFRKLIYYSRTPRLFPYNLHWLLPIRLGHLYHKYYGFWAK